jgi:hypothetical protein
MEYGMKIHTDGEKWGKENTFGDPQTDRYVEAIQLTVNAEDLDGKKWARDNFNWDNIGNQWNERLSS